MFGCLSPGGGGRVEFRREALNAFFFSGTALSPFASSNSTAAGSDSTTRPMILVLVSNVVDVDETVSSRQWSCREVVAPIRILPLSTLFLYKLPVTAVDVVRLTFTQPESFKGTQSRRLRGNTRSVCLDTCTLKGFAHSLTVPAQSMESLPHRAFYPVEDECQ